MRGLRGPACSANPWVTCAYWPPALRGGATVGAVKCTLPLLLQSSSTELSAWASPSLAAVSLPPSWPRAGKASSHRESTATTTAMEGGKRYSCSYDCCTALFPAVPPRQQMSPIHYHSTQLLPQPHNRCSPHSTAFLDQLSRFHSRPCPNCCSPLRKSWMELRRFCRHRGGKGGGEGGGGVNRMT